MQPGQLVRDVIAWRIEDDGPVPAWMKAVGAVAAIGAVAVASDGAMLGGGAGGPTYTERLSENPDEALYLGSLVVETTTPWTPNPWDKWIELFVSQRAAWTRVGWGEMDRRHLPLQRLSVVRAVGESRFTRRRTVDSRWRLILTDGQITFAVKGSWQALAWLGTVAGWPEPR